MRNGFVCSLVVLCSLIAAAQNSLPQWKVVKLIELKGSAAVQPFTLLSPKNNSLYRVSAYLLVTSSEQQSAGYDFGLQWTDQTGNLEDLGEFATANGTSSETVNPTLFSAKANTPVVGFVQLSDPPPQNATYNIVVTFEQLTTAPLN